MKVRKLPRKKPTLATMVLLGLVLGIACGVFFGELMKPLHTVGIAFIRLLQMSVLPYIVVSLITGLGRLTYGEAGKLARKAGLILLLLWSLVLVVVVLTPIAFPDWERASFFSTSSLEDPRPFDLVELYIPSNPFQSLANTVIPAIVVFSFALGIALIGVREKEPLLQWMGTIEEALSAITRFVVKLAPVGVFALIASAAGTMEVAELRDLQVYLITYLLVWAVMVFWIVPGLVMSFTPLKYREVIGETKGALITAFATGSLMVVLPILAEKSRNMLARHEVTGEEVDSTVGVVVPTSYSFPSSGVLLSLAFVLFGAWLNSSPLSAVQYPVFAVSGLVSFFGSPTVSLPFLLDMFHLPADLFQLFLVADVVVARFGTMLAAVHVLALTLLVACSMAGRLRVRARSLIRYAVVSVVLLITAIGGARLLLDHVVTREYQEYRVFVEMELNVNTVPVVVHESPPAPSPDPARPTLQRIENRGAIRVCYFKDRLPHVFLNASGNLVGLDVAMAHQLAADLSVSLEFVRVEYREMARHLDEGACDIVMSGLGVTADRILEMALSRTCGWETLAFIVPDHRRDDFETREEIERLAGLRVAVPDKEYYLRWVRNYLPNATVVPIDTAREFFRTTDGSLDALAYSAESGSAWTLVYPDYTVAIPQPDLVRIPLAYAMRRGDEDWVDYVNAWIELKRDDGSFQAAYDHWILGQDAERKGPRWSVIRDVLGWVD